MSFRKPLPRSKTPDPHCGRENHTTGSAVPGTVNRGDARGRLFKSNTLPRRIAKSENDLSAQRKPVKSKEMTFEMLSEEDRLALSYNAYLQSALIAVHDAKIRERKQQELVTAMENQQSELMALEEEDNFLDSVLLKIELFKKMKEEITSKIDICEQINASTDERVLDAQIKAVEENITQKLLKNFKLPDTDEDKKEVLDLFNKISEELNKIPEIKQLIQPLNEVCSTLLKAKELDDEAEKLKTSLKKKMKLAEESLYDLFYLKTKIWSEAQE